MSCKDFYSLDSFIPWFLWPGDRASLRVTRSRALFHSSPLSRVWNVDSNYANSNNLDAGDGTNEMPGIRQYTGAGWQFSLENDPVTFIITPRSRDDPQPGKYLYGPEVAQIKTKLRSLIPGAEPRIFDYEVRNRTTKLCHDLGTD